MRANAVGKRGENAFRRNDAIRAVKAARDAGVEPAVFEIVTSDGTTFRIFGVGAAPTETTQDTGWNEEIEKLKATATPPKAKGR
jgi:hypothetical protein